MKKNIAICTLTMLFFLLSGCLFADNNNLPRTIATPIPHINFPLALEWSQIFPNRIVGMAVSDKVLTLVMKLDQGLVLQTLDFKTGELLWEKGLDQGANGENFYTNIQIHGSRIFVTYAATIYAIDEKSGDILWQAEGLESGYNEILSFSKKHILVVDVSRKLLAYDIETGKIDWEMKINRGTVSLFFDDSLNTVYFFQGTTSKAINDENGNTFWEQDVSPCSARTYHNQVIYCANGDEKHPGVEAYDLLNKSTVWNVELANPGKFLSVNDKGLERLIGQSDKTLTSIDINSGKVDWEYILPVGDYRPSVILNDVIYSRNYYSGLVTALDLSDGEYLGYLELQPKDSILFAQADNMLVNPSGTLLVLYHMNHVFAYK